MIIKTLSSGGSSSSAVDANGNITSPSTLIAASTESATLEGGAADGASAVGVVLDNTAALSNASAKLTSFRSAGTEKAAVLASGTINSASGTLAATASNTSIVLKSNVTDGGSAVAHKFESTNTLSTSGAKIAAFYTDTGSTEVASVDKTGLGSFSGGLKFGGSNTLTDGGSRSQFSGDVLTSSVIMRSGSFIYIFGGGTVEVVGSASDGATAIGTKISTNGLTYSTAGAKILSVRNNTTEKLAVGKNGQLHTPTGNADSVAGTATLSGGTVTVSTTAVSASSMILVSHNTPGGTMGHLSAPVASIVAATSFVINSSSGTDTSTVNWWIIN